MFRLFTALTLLAAAPLLAEADETFTPFAGKISGNRVRVRLEPNVESNILKEANAGDLFTVLDETDAFYAIQPPSVVLLILRWL